MDMFKMVKEAAAMKSRLNEMEKTLKATMIDVDDRGVKVTMNGKAELLDIKLAPEVLQRDREKIEKDILSAVQQAIKKSQEVMAEHAKKMTGGLKIPGL
jgi:DNA-binding YbaB/EbfC family protein